MKEIFPGDKAYDFTGEIGTFEFDTDKIRIFEFQISGPNYPFYNKINKNNDTDPFYGQPIDPHSYIKK